MTGALTFSQIDDLLSSAKESFVKASVDVLRKKGVSDEDIAVFRQSTERTLILYNLSVISEVKKALGMRGGEA